jgi:phosphoglycerol transferase
MGLFHVVLFRSVNRASVVVLTLVMIFGAWAVPHLLRGLPVWARRVAMLAVASLAIVDLKGLDNPMESVANNRKQADNDRHLAAKLDAAFPAGAMVFQLPAMHFPEVGPVHAVDSYELFRPYYFSNTLRFSHGDVKGRPNADWKFRLAAMPAAPMVSELKAAGFAAILVNRKGYPDGAAALVQQLLEAGCKVVVVSELGDNVALSL